MLQEDPNYGYLAILLIIVVVVVWGMVTYIEDSPSSPEYNFEFFKLSSYPLQWFCSSEVLSDFAVRCLGSLIGNSMQSFHGIILNSRSFLHFFCNEFVLLMFLVILQPGVRGVRSIPLWSLPCRSSLFSGVFFLSYGCTLSRTCRLWACCFSEWGPPKASFSFVKRNKTIEFRVG